MAYYPPPPPPVSLNRVYTNTTIVVPANVNLLTVGGIVVEGALVLIGPLCAVKG